MTESIVFLNGDGVPTERVTISREEYEALLINRYMTISTVSDEFQLPLPIPDDDPQPDADLTQQAEDEFPEDEYHGYDSPIEDSPFEDPDYDEDNDDPRGYNEDERNLHYLSPFDGMNL